MSNSSSNPTPDRPIDVKVVLADHAQIADGKLFISGAGWTDMTGAVPFALAMMFEVPREQTGKEHTFAVDLIDADGKPAMTPTAQGMQPWHFEGTMQVDPDEGAPAAASFVSPFVIKQQPTTLTPASYEWRWYVDGETRENWRLPFRVH
jgi:hypothetical protein